MAAAPCKCCGLVWPIGYVDDVTAIDCFADWLLATKQSDRYFTRNTVLRVLQKHKLRIPGWTPDQASMALQAHRVAPRTGRVTRHVLRRRGFGPAVRWFYVQADDVPAMERELCREKAAAIVKEHVCRILPGATSDPAVRLEMDNATQIIERQLEVLGSMVATITMLRTDPADDFVAAPAS